MPVSDYSTAVQSASADLVTAAGAGKVARITTSWPLITDIANFGDYNSTGYINRLYGTAPSASQVEALAEYLAVASLCHILDAWRYLAESAHSLIRGARNVALHLAYYAELRAALSILGVSGIGIANNKNFAIDQRGNVNWFEGRTHTIAWQAIVEWSKQDSSALTVIDSFMAQGISANDWAQACQITPSRPRIAQDWLRDWSIDLRVLRQDSYRRNDVTYNPDLRVDALETAINPKLEVVKHACEAANPISGGEIGSLDIAVVNNLCEKCSQLLGISLPDLRSRLETWLINYRSLEPTYAQALVASVLDAQNSSGGRILTLAKAATPHVAEPVFCRAFLLLRLACATFRQLVRNMEFIAPGGRVSWVRQTVMDYGCHVLLWDSNTIPADLSFLSNEQMEALDDLSNWSSTIPGELGQRLWNERAVQATRLCQFERVGILALLS